MVKAVTEMGTRWRSCKA